MSTDHDVATEADVPRDKPILLFDGVCNLCTGTVQWVLERDDEEQFRFASLQSGAGQALLAEFGLPTDDFDTFVLVEGGEYYTKSTAVLRVARRLGVPYAALYPLIGVPSFLRDRVYDLVADHRYEVFGKRDACMMPSSELQDRFLE